MCTEYNQEKTTCPAEALFHHIIQAYESYPHYSLGSHASPVQKFTGSIANGF